MKKTRILLALLLVLATLATFAGCNKNQGEEPKEIGYIVNADGTRVTVLDSHIKIYSHDDMDGASETIQKLLNAHYEALTEEELADLAPDLLLTLKAMSTYLETTDMTLGNLAYVELSEDLQALMEAGGTITLTFTGKWRSSDFLMPMYMYEGEWLVLDADFVEILEDGSVRITFQHNPGLVALMTVSNDYVGSIYQPGTPYVGAETEGVYYDIAVPYYAKDDADEDVADELEEGYEDIVKAENLGDVVPGLEDSLKETGTELTVEDLIVRDIFYIDLDDETKEAMNESGLPITLKFELGLEEDDFLMVLLYNDGEWTVVSSEDVRYREDGATAVDFPVDVGVVAFVVQKDAE